MRAVLAVGSRPQATMTTASDIVQNPIVLLLLQMRLNLENCAITLDLDGRTPSIGTFLLGNFASAFPGCALENLRQGETCPQRLANVSGDAVPVWVSER